MGHEFRLADSISHQLRRVEQMASDRFTKLVGESGLTLRQFEVLAAISERPGLSQSDLVDETGIDRSTLADMMLRMQKRGWVERVQSEKDARANAVNLTPSGAALLHSAVPHARAADAHILHALSKPKAKAFQVALHRLVKAADEANAAAQRKAARAAKKLLKAEAKKANALAGEHKKNKRKKKDEPSR